jgi:translation elongation factor EF-Tu-like GTPase
MPPDGQNWPQLWMTVSDVFHIRGRGTVVTGLLEGNGLLYPGGSLVCDGIAWQVSGIEQFRTVLTAAEPGSQVGVLLSGGPAGDVLRGRTVQFIPADAAANPQFTVLAPKRKRWRR